MSGINASLRPTSYSPGVRNAHEQNRPKNTTDNTANQTREVVLASAKKSTNDDLGVGDRGTEVLVAQQALKDAGHSPGAIDGIYGKQTSAAVESFQQESIESLERTLVDLPGSVGDTVEQKLLNLKDEYARGVIGRETQILLAQAGGANNKELSFGSLGGDVVSLQESLEQAGFSAGSADGIFGPKTNAATREFQQSRIDVLEATLQAPINLPDTLRSETVQKLDALRDEMARGVAGKETHAQLRSVNARTTEKAPDTVTPEVDGPNVANPELDLPDLDLPDLADVTEVIDAIKEADINGALAEALNSEGDNVSIKLGASADLPLGVAGIEGEVQAQVTRTADGYELSLAADVAGTLGLAVDGRALGVGAKASAGSTVKYQFDTLADVQKGVEALIVTAGKSPAVEAAVDVADEASGLFNRIVDKLGDKVDGLPGFARDHIFGNIDKFVDSAIDTLPDEIGIPFGPKIDLRDLKEDFQELDRLRNDLDNKIGAINDAQAEAAAFLDDSFESIEVRGSVGLFADIGVPLQAYANGAELGINANVDAEVTGVFNKDGSVSVQVAYQSGASIQAGAGISGSLTTANSITFNQDFVRNGNGFRAAGEAQVQFRTDSELLAKAGVGVTADIGVGGDLVFTTDARALGEKMVDINRAFMNGDLEAAFTALGEVEGDLEIGGRVVGGASFGAGGGAVGAQASVDGQIQAEDHIDLVDVEDLTLAEAFDFLNEQLLDAADDLRAFT